MSKRVHALKTWPSYYSAILSGHKTFELRLNDRRFEAGDTLHLQEYDPVSKTYTGRFTFRRVTYILLAHAGLHADYVVMGLGPS